MMSSITRGTFSELHFLPIIVKFDQHLVKLFKNKIDVFMVHNVDSELLE